MDNLHVDVLSEIDCVLEDCYPFEYFQSLDSEGKFPQEFFKTLKEKELLSFVIGGEKEFYVFSEIAEIIGRKSVAAALCWVMHNQQFNIVLKLKPSVLKNNDIGLISSMTSSFGGKWYGERDGIIQYKNKSWVNREAPIVSYARYADSVLFTFPRSVGHKKETWLALASNKYCFTGDVEENLSGVKSTCSEPCKVFAELGNIEFIGSLNDVFSDLFVPIAHIGWMSGYNGGLNGVLSRIRKVSRNGISVSSINKINTSSLSQNRIAKAVSIERTNKSIIQGAIKSLYCKSNNNNNNKNNQRSIYINSVKTQISETLLEASLGLELELGTSIAMKQCEPTGIEIYSRDVKAARLMFNNDKLYELIYKHWIIGM
ncbi:hypothetical protein ACSLVK_00125 [Photorhabdus tasmaniensis]|uniref:hypothetical protein n=1 Tax=Photorhabdus tasmaniensis TaxID=1004159 RepID=UPI004041A1F9